ncbi:helix-turn-helix domain-containing protein [Marinitenerispora sediminis]|nr:helix-turn-helix transcriptional regulator [Marinitenerispora sediminis]
MNELGPTGQQVAANVRRFRRLRGLSTTELARRLTEVGRPTIAGAITRIEAGRRRVDADDLVALAQTLGVTPSALLLPPTAEGHTEVTGAGQVPAHDAWRWMDGQWPLGASRDPEELRKQLTDFHLHARPYGIPPYQSVDDAVVWMRDFDATPFEKDRTAPGQHDRK